MFRMFLTFRVDAITSLSMYRAFHGMYRAKGQLISRRLFDVIVSTKKLTILNKDFLPVFLKRGQTKKIRALISLIRAI